MSNHGAASYNTISPGASFQKCATAAFAVASLPASIAFFILRDWDLYWPISAAILAEGVVGNMLLKGMPEHEIPPEYVGVGTVRGEPKEQMYAPGTHKYLPGIGGFINVRVAPKRYDPPAFTELPKDDVPVVIDEYFMATIKNPFLWVNLGGPDRDEDLQKHFVSATRLFVSQWDHGKQLVQMRDTLAEFLRLPCNDATAAREYREKYLQPLTVGDNAPLTTDAVDKIMENAGHFCGSISKWGYSDLEIHVEKVDLPESIKAAAAAKAAEPDIMGNYQIRQDGRLKMAKELREAFPDISGVDAMNYVDQLLDLAVDRKIYEVHVRDLEKVVTDPNVAGALAQIARRYVNPKQGGNRNERSSSKRAPENA